MRIYFVTAGRADEKAIIKRLQPPRLLLSYHYFRGKSLKDFTEDLGYMPEIMLDSGAYSAWTTGKDVALTAYLRFVDANRPHIAEYIALDVIGNPRMSLRYYDIMVEEGFADCLPVYHYGAGLEWLREYQDRGADYIALGNTVPESNKKLVVDWVNGLSRDNSDTAFHLLGSSHHIILDGAERLESHDSSSWIMMAANGYPKNIPGRGRGPKLQRMEANMMSLYFLT